MDAVATYRFGLFEFDASSLELRRSGTRVALEPQPARALALLLSQAGETITRAELKRAVWGTDIHVDFDRGLAYVISQIRTALGDSADNPRFLQTLPRRGYKFIAPVEVVQSVRTLPGSMSFAPPTPDPVERPPSASRHRRFWGVAALALLFGFALVQALRPDRPVVIAVSVFDNETGMPEHDLLVSSLADVVVTRLTQLDPDAIAVVGNSAVLRQPRNIRNLAALRDQLKADYVLLGQLQRDDTGLRFITHFIRLRDEAHLKANRLTFPDGDLRNLQSEVVGEFERAVRTFVLASHGS